MDPRLLLQMVTATGEGRLLYLSVPLTSGLREVELLGDLGCDSSTFRSRHNDSWVAMVRRNEGEAFVYAELLRKRVRDLVVLDPSRLHAPEWSQDDYGALWGRLIAEQAIALAVAPRWEFSHGCRFEVDHAASLGLPIFSTTGMRMTMELLSSVDEGARRLVTAKLGARGESYLRPIPSVREFAEPATRGDDAESDHNERDRATAEVVGWLMAERGYQLSKFGARLDDQHTAEGFAPDSWWVRQLGTYIHRASVLGVATESGRQAVAKFCATACGLGESLVRVSGRIDAAPDVAPADLFGVLSPASSADQRLFRWLIASRAAQADDCFRQHDAWAREPFETGGAWWDQLMELLARLSEHSPSQHEGRIVAGELVALATGCAESLVRTFGPLPAPGVPSGFGIHRQSA